MTQELSAAPDGGSRVGFYMTFEEANPASLKLMEGIVQGGVARLKAYCEAEVRA